MAAVDTSQAAQHSSRGWRKGTGKRGKNFNPSVTNLVEFLPEIEDGGKFIRPDFSVKFAASCDRSSQDPELGDNLNEESTSSESLRQREHGSVTAGECTHACQPWVAIILFEQDCTVEDKYSKIKHCNSCQKRGFLCRKYTLCHYECLPASLLVHFKLYNAFHSH